MQKHIGFQTTFEVDPRILQIEKKTEEEYKDRKMLERQLLSKGQRQQELEKLKLSQLQAIQSLSLTSQQPRSITQTQVSQNTLSMTASVQSSKRNQLNYTYSPKQPVNQRAIPTYTDQVHITRAQAGQQFDPLSSKLGSSLQQSPLPASQDHHGHECAICQEKARKMALTASKLQKEILDINKIILQSKVLIENNQLVEAQKFMQRFISMDVYQHSDLFFLYGDVLRQLNLYQEAEHYLLEALKFKIYSPRCLISLGQCYMRMEKYARASVLLKKALEYEDTATTNHLLALSLLQSKQYLESAIHLTRAIELAPRNHAFYLTRGMVYKKLGYLELAMNDFRVYKDLHPYYKQDLGQQILEAEEGRDLDLRDRLKELIEQLDVSN